MVKDPWTVLEIGIHKARGIHHRILFLSAQGQKGGQVIVHVTSLPWVDSAGLSDSSKSKLFSEVIYKDIVVE